MSDETAAVDTTDTETEVASTAIPEPVPGGPTNFDAWSEAHETADKIVNGSGEEPPPPEDATGATAGTPGTWTPEGATVPADLAALQAGAYVADPTTPWTTGQSVQTADSADAYWDGSGWLAGVAP